MLKVRSTDYPDITQSQMDSVSSEIAEYNSHF